MNPFADPTKFPPEKGWTPGWIKFWLWFVRGICGLSMSIGIAFVILATLGYFLNVGPWFADGSTFLRIGFGVVISAVSFRALWMLR
jgi:hypothetical protein